MSTDASVFDKQKEQWEWKKSSSRLDIKMQKSSFTE